jgi:hypothetical protein
VLVISVVREHNQQCVRIVRQLSLCSVLDLGELQMHVPLD